MHTRPGRCDLAANCVNSKLELMNDNAWSYLQRHRIIVVIISKHPESFQASVFVFMASSELRTPVKGECVWLEGAWIFRELRQSKAT